MSKQLILIDGNAIFHRAFHALPLLHSEKHGYTNAILGFFRMLLDLTNKLSPDYLIVAFDHKSKTLRHAEFSEYKANRSAPPPELYPQLPLLKELLTRFNISICELEGYEADDLIGTLARKSKKFSNLQTVIVTADMDSYQLIDDQTKVFSPQMGFSQAKLYSPADIKEKIGITPSQIVDYKALKGDTSDNIPGVPGIGDKQAVELLNKYTNLETIYQNLENLPEGQRKKLFNGKESAFLSKKLATIIINAPIDLNLQKAELKPIDSSIAKAAFTELEFTSLVKKLSSYPKIIKSAHESTLEKQNTLF